MHMNEQGMNNCRISTKCNSMLLCSNSQLQENTPGVVRMDYISFRYFDSWVHIIVKADICSMLLVLINYAEMIDIVHPHKVIQVKKVIHAR